jgi:hypothetical protein
MTRPRAYGPNRRLFRTVDPNIPKAGLSVPQMKRRLTPTGHFRSWRGLGLFRSDQFSQHFASGFVFGPGKLLLEEQISPVDESFHVVALPDALSLWIERTGLCRFCETCYVNMMRMGSAAPASPAWQQSRPPWAGGAGVSNAAAPSIFSVEALSADIPLIDIPASEPRMSWPRGSVRNAKF